MGWFSRLFSGHREHAPVNAAQERTEPTMPQELAAQQETPTAPAPFEAASPASVPVDPLPWLLNSAPLTAADLSEAERSALQVLDKTLALPAIPDNLLPRAAALIPQLIALVRQTDLPVPAIAERVGKDAVLAAELMRLASSPYYRVQGDVTDLEQAISLIGLQGLQTVIARVLLKPIYQAAPGPLGGRVSPRMWEHSEALARHTAILSEPAGQSVFDGYLVGMLHDTGWTIALTVIDRANITLDLPASEAFGHALNERVHRLFGHAARRWDITPGFKEFARDARHNGPTLAVHPMAAVLREAHARCMAELSPQQTVAAPLGN